MSGEKKTAADQLAELRAKQAKRAEALEAQRTEQELQDELAIDAFREQHGDMLSVVVLNAWQPGTPTLAAARPASKGEIKRYQDSVKVSIRDRETTVTGSSDAAILLARSCCLYPDEKVLLAMADKYPGFLQQLGQEVLGKAQARAQADAKR